MGTGGAGSAAGDRVGAHRLSPHRRAAGVPLQHVIHLPFERPADRNVTAVAAARSLFDGRPEDEMPAAFIVESVQGEGGLHAASDAWLVSIAECARAYGALLIVDDIQAGCGRTGTFFSFENSRIQPDVICLSKSIGGAGLPLALVLIRPQFDVWRPGEHNGTFRGNNLAFVGGAVALQYWRDPGFELQIKSLAVEIDRRIRGLAERYDGQVDSVRGRGMMRGLALRDPRLAAKISENAFHNRLIVERCGPRSEVLKILPPLTIEPDTLEAGLNILEESFDAVLNCRTSAVNLG